MRARLKNALRFVLYLGTGVAILWIVFNRQQKNYQAKCALEGQDPSECHLATKILQDFGSAEWLWIILVLGAFMLSNIHRAIRWQMLLEPLGIRASFYNRFFTVMIGYFANLGLPRIGELVRAATLARYEDAKTQQVMGTVVIDRMFDVVSMALIVALAIFLDGPRILEYLSRNAETGSMTDLLLSPYLWIAAFIGVGTLYALYRYRARYAGHPVAARIIEVLRGFRDGLGSVRRVRRPGWFLFHSIMIWVMYYLMTLLCFKAFAGTTHLGPVAGLTTFVFGSFGIIIPAPGGMGTFQFLVSEALVMYGIPGEDGFSFSMILFFSIQIFCNILFGLLGLLLLPVLNRRRSGQPEPA